MTRTQKEWEKLIKKHGVKLEYIFEILKDWEEDRNNLMSQEKISKPSYTKPNEYSKK